MAGGAGAHDRVPGNQVVYPPVEGTDDTAVDHGAIGKGPAGVEAGVVDHPHLAINEEHRHLAPPGPDEEAALGLQAVQRAQLYRGHGS